MSKNTLEHEIGELVIIAVNVLGWIVLATILTLGLVGVIRSLVPFPGDTQEVTIEQAE